MSRDVLSASQHIDGARAALRTLADAYWPDVHTAKRMSDAINRLEEHTEALAQVLDPAGRWLAPSQVSRFESLVREGLAREDKTRECLDAAASIVLIEARRHSHTYRWSDVKASKSGGPAPRCKHCGEPAR